VRSMLGRPVYITAPGELVAVAEIKSEYTFDELTAMALSTEASSKARRPVYITAGGEFPAIGLWFHSKEAAGGCASRLCQEALERHLADPRSWILPQSEGASGSAMRLPPTGFPSPLPKYAP